MKKLVTGKTVQDFANENKGKDFPVDEDTLITPNAKDTAYALGIRFVDKDELKGSYCSAMHKDMKSEAAPCKENADSEEKDIDIDLDREKVVKAVIEVLTAKGLI